MGTRHNDTTDFILRAILRGAIGGSLALSGCLGGASAPGGGVVSCVCWPVDRFTFQRATSPAVSIFENNNSSESTDHGFVPIAKNQLIMRSRNGMLVSATKRSAPPVGGIQ